MLHVLDELAEPVARLLVVAGRELLSRLLELLHQLVPSVLLDVDRATDECCEIVELLGSSLDRDLGARRRDRHLDQRVAGRHLARQRVADLIRRRRVRRTGRAGDRSAVQEPPVPVEAERGARGLLAGPARPRVAAAGLGGAEIAAASHRRCGDRCGRRVRAGAAHSSEGGALVGEPQVAVRAGVDPARAAPRGEAGRVPDDRMRDRIERRDRRHRALVREPDQPIRTHREPAQAARRSRTPRSHASTG